MNLDYGENMKFNRDLEWSKEWTGAYTIFSSSYDGLVMTDKIKEYLGISFEQCVIICRAGQAEGYIPEEKIEKFGRFLAREIDQNSGTVERWTGEITKQANLFFKSVVQNTLLNYQKYLSLRNIFIKYASYHAAIKRVIDFLPEKTLEKVLPLFTKARVGTEEVYPKAEAIFKQICQSISDETGYSQEMTSALGKTEIEKYFESKELPNKEILIERLKGCALVFDGTRYEIFVSDDFKFIAENIASGGARNEVKGVQAYGGKVTGRARIVLNPSSIDNFQEGDILVTGMTRPEYLPLIRKSSAFVTDAGGVLSHAAITARELKKPCVIGTKIATKVFKDGDVIEVDAERGIVKLISASGGEKVEE